MAGNPLERHPFGRRLLILAVAVPLFVVAAVLAFAWPSARIQPRDVPIGVVAAGSGSATQQLAGGLDRAAPDGFELRLYPDAAAAREAIADRDVYGAFALDDAGLTVYEASAASPTVAQAVTTAGTALAGHLGVTAHVRDVVPISAQDPRGSVLSGSLLPLSIGSVAIAAVVALLLPARPLWRRLVSLLVISSVVAVGVLLVAQGFLGALPNQHLATFGALVLTLLSLSSAAAGLVALIGPAGLGLASLGIVFLGNAFAGATSAPDLLPGAVHVIGQWLPPGAAVSLLRGTAYFDGHGVAEPLGVLLVWLVLGVAGMVAGHRRLLRTENERPPVRLAAVTSPVGTDDTAHTDDTDGGIAPRHALTGAP